jgi:hypothetical protein
LFDPAGAVQFVERIERALIGELMANGGRALLSMTIAGTILQSFRDGETYLDAMEREHPRPRSTKPTTPDD